MTSKTFFRYVIPTILAMWIFSIYTLMDGFFAVHFVGPEASVAANLTMLVTNALFSLGILVSVETSTRIGIDLGRDRVNKTDEVSPSVLSRSGLFTLATSVLLVVFIGSLTHFLGATGDLHDLVVGYLSLTLPFTFFFILFYILKILVKVDGMPILSTIRILSSALINIILDYIFIRFFGWGVRRAALATGLAQILSLVIFFRHFLARKGRLRILLIKPQLVSLVKAMKIDFEDLLIELSYLAILSLLSRSLLVIYGETGLISYAVINYFSLLLTMTMPGIIQGFQPLPSLYYGKEDLEAIRKIFVSALAAIFVASAVSFLPAQFLPSSLVQIFIPKTERVVSGLVIYTLRLYSISYLFLGYSILVSDISAVLNEPRLGVLISLSRGFIFIFIFLHLSKAPTPNSIWLADSLAEMTTLVLTIFPVLHPRKDLAKQEQIEGL